MEGKVKTREKNGNSQGWRDVTVADAVDTGATGKGTGAALAIHMPMVAHVIKDQASELLLMEDQISCVFETMNTIKRTCESNVGLDITMAAWVRGGGAVYETCGRGYYKDSGKTVDAANYDDAAADILSTGLLAYTTREKIKPRVIDDECMCGLTWYAISHRVVVFACRDLRDDIIASRAKSFVRRDRANGDHLAQRNIVALDARAHETCDDPAFVAASTDTRLDARATLCKVLGVTSVDDITPDMIARAAAVVETARNNLTRDCNKFMQTHPRSLAYGQLARKIVVGVRDGDYVIIATDGEAQRTIYNLTGKSMTDLAQLAAV